LATADLTPGLSRSDPRKIRASQQSDFWLLAGAFTGEDKNSVCAIFVSMDMETKPLLAQKDRGKTK
jgi:hypothetical protein